MLYLTFNTPSFPRARACLLGTASASLFVVPRHEPGTLLPASGGTEHRAQSTRHRAPGYELGSREWPCCFPTKGSGDRGTGAFPASLELKAVSEWPAPCGPSRASPLPTQLLPWAPPWLVSRRPGSRSAHSLGLNANFATDQLLVHISEPDLS